MTQQVRAKTMGKPISTKLYFSNDYYEAEPRQRSHFEFIVPSGAKAFVASHDSDDDDGHLTFTV